MPNQQFEDLPYRFTRDELLALGQELARANQKIYTLRSDLKTSAAVLTGAVKEAEAEASALTQKINEKSELRPTEVRYLMDLPQAGQKTLVRVDTQEEVRVEGMTEQDRQGSLAFTDDVPPDSKSAAAGESKKRRTN